MAFASFRDFVAQLERAGELKRVAQPVATELEITEIADREMKSPGGGKALLFEKPTVNGQISPFPVAINTMGSHKRMAMSLGANSVDEVAAELGSLMKAKPPTSFREAIKLLGQALDLRHAKPRIVKDGTCKEVVHLVESSKLRVEGWPPAPDWTSASCSALAKDPFVNALKRIARCWETWSFSSDSELSVWTSLVRSGSSTPCAIWPFRAIMSLMGTA